MDASIFQLIDGYLETHLTTAPFVIFGLLLLAGFFLPVSEDLMVLTAALLSARHPELTGSVFIALFLGAFCSDIICYSLMGRYLGNKLINTSFISRFVSRQMLEQVQSFYNQYGIPTLFFGRFIPFGVRNALFFSAGLSKMNPVKFVVTDFFACLLAIMFYFSLYYNIGKSILKSVDTAKMFLFGLAVVVALGFSLKKFLFSRGSGTGKLSGNPHRPPENPTNVP